MPARQFTLQQNSPIIGQIDPIVKKRLQAGDQVVECMRRKHVYLQSSWDYLGGKCTLCDEDGGGKTPQPSGGGGGGPSTLPINITLGGLIAIVLCLLLAIGGIVLVVSQMPVTNPAPATQIVIVRGTREVQVITATPNPSITSLPSSTPYPENDCPGALSRRLEVGQTGRVTFSNGLSVRVRTHPNTSASVIVKMPEGEHFSVVGGPECANGRWWWHVRTLGGDVGWAAEGDNSLGYYLEPFP